MFFPKHQWPFFLLCEVGLQSVAIWFNLIPIFQENIRQVIRPRIMKTITLPFNTELIIKIILNVMNV